MINLLIADALKPDCGHVTVDMDQIEVGHRRVSHRLPRHTRLKLFNGTRPGVRVNGQDFVRLELVALAADATAKAGFFGETDKLLQQRKQPGFIDSVAKQSAEHDVVDGRWSLEIKTRHCGPSNNACIFENLIRKVKVYIYALFWFQSLEVLKGMQNHVLEIQ